MPETQTNPILADSPWQMSIGERAAMEGLLSVLAPALAIEIGTAEGSSLRRIAAHSVEVHSFDMVEPSEEVASLPNVTLHTGDSHLLLPEVLAAFAEQERNVDFVLVDGDHSALGVRRDLEDLLDSPAIARTAILLHDVCNEEVRRGIDAVRLGAWPKVAYVDMDCVPGYVFKEERMRFELWGGLGIVLVDAARQAYGAGSPYQERVYPAAELLAAMRDRLAARPARPAPGKADTPTAEVAALDAEIAALREALERQRAVQRDLERSASWRLTAPLRAAKRKLVADRAR